VSPRRVNRGISHTFDSNTAHQRSPAREEKKSCTWLDYRAKAVRASSLVTLSDSSIEAVTGVAETGNDETVLVELLIQSSQDDGDVATSCCLLQGRETLR